MSRAAGIYRSKLGDRPLPASFLKSRTDAGKLWSKAVLSAPFPDLAGDIVRPEGLNFAEHQLDPSVDLEHGRHPEVRGMPVAWARESLSEPGGPYAVEMKALDFGTGDAPDVHTVPIGTSYFDPSCKVSMQCFALVEQDALPATSLEFRMVPGFAKALGRSPLEPRSAYDFGRADVVRWTLTGRGVCPHALTLRKSLPASVTQVPRELAKLLTDRRVLVGANWEPLHGVILKSLSAAYPLPAKKSRVTVRVERKAMPEPDADDDLDKTGDADLETADTGGAPSPVNGVTGLYDAAQKLIDACEGLKAAMENTDNPKLYADAMKHIAVIEADAAKLKGTGDKHDAAIQAMKTGAAGPAEPDGDEEGDIETDDEGVMKALREPYRTVLKALRDERGPTPRHFHIAEVDRPVKGAAKAAPDISPEALAMLAGLDAKFATIEAKAKHL